MYQHAVVVAIKTNNMLTVSCDTGGCENCKAGALCSTKGKTFSAANHSGLKLGIGDNVELYLPPGKTVFAGVIAIMVPLILFPLG